MNPTDLQAAPDSSSNVTPKEQKIYDAIMVAARENVFGSRDDDTRFRMILKRLADGKAEIAQNIGGIAAVTLINIQGAAEKKGRHIPGDILFHAGDELVDDLIEIAVAGKLMNEAQHDQVKKGALFEGLKLYGENEKREGKVTPEKKAEAQSELRTIQGRAGIIGKRVNKTGAPA